MIPKKLKTFTKLITNPRQLVVFLASNRCLDWIPDKPYLKMFYWGMVGKRLNLKNPKGFNEKLQWMKLYYHNPDYVQMVDKYAVKSYIAEKYPDIKLIHTLGVWNNADEIDFDGLPDQFVLKCTHDSGSVIICKDKSGFDFEKAKNDLQRALNANMYHYGREWVYKEVQPRIIAEEYVQDDDSDELKDYKFMCFDGEVKCIFVCTDRFSPEGLHVTFFDRDWNVLPFTRHYPRKEEGVPRPTNLSKMIEYAERMSKGMPFVRIDFYSIKGEIFFGEYTFFPGCGFEEFTPDEWDYKLGDWIKLPERNVQ